MIQFWMRAPSTNVQRCVPNGETHSVSPPGLFLCSLARRSVAALLDFAESANLTVLFGLNDLFMRPTKTKPEKKLCNEQTGCPQGNLSNAEALLRWTAAQRPRGPLWGFELGK